MKKFHFLIGAIFAAFLISACDGEDSRKVLRNTGSPFGKVGGSHRDQKVDHKDDTNKAKPNGQPFGSLE